MGMIMIGSYMPTSDCDREKCVIPTSYTVPTYPSKEFMDNLPVEIIYNGTIDPILIK